MRPRTLGLSLTALCGVKSITASLPLFDSNGLARAPAAPSPPPPLVQRFPLIDSLWRKAVVVNVAIDRAVRDVVTAMLMIHEYKQVQDQDDWTEGHIAAAERMLTLCEVNQGVYIKLGQHLSQLEYLLPLPFCVTMRKTLNNAPQDTFSQVRSVVEADLGAPLHTVFQSFEETPVASASLAQVHVARLLDGRKVAVKVQHEGLVENSTADIATIETLVSVVARLFPDFRYEWLVDEMKRNLPQELDFVHEAANMKRFSNAFGDDPHVSAPTAVSATQRVLVMTFEEGEHVIDSDKVLALGVNPADVTNLINRVFAKQMFILGLVHCDPHGANVLIRNKSTNGGSDPELILLDHGLYRSLTREFRLNYAHMWHSLIYGDADGIRHYGELMGASGMPELFAAILTARTWDQIIDDSSINRLHVDDEVRQRQLVMQSAGDYAKEISKILNECPRELLLLLKTNDCLRAITAPYGQPIDSHVTMSRHCVEAITQAEREEERSFRVTVGTWVTRMRLESWLAVVRLVNWIGW